jgi:hypothetical protein
MYLPDVIQQTLRELNKISEHEVVQKQGDIYVAIHVITSDRRVLEKEKHLIESLSVNAPNTIKKILKG